MTTVGVEEEFHIVNLRTRYLEAAAPRLLAHLPEGSFAAEAKQTCLETRTRPHTSISTLRDEVHDLRRTLVRTARSHDVGVIASGTAPLMRLEDAANTEGDRIARMDHSYARLFSEQQICGLHVHVGLPDRDLAARAVAWINPWVATLVALTANSPYWLGQETGYASWRTIVWHRWPSAGPAPQYTSADQYARMVDALVRCGVIRDRRMVYHDIRLSEHLPTIELRACDAVSDPGTTAMTAALFRALVLHACDRVHAGEQPPELPDSWLRAASWRAARSGLEGTLVDPVTMAAIPAGDMVRRLIRALQPELSLFGDLEMVRAHSEDLLRLGSSARRQRAVGRRHGLASLVDALITSTALKVPVGGDQRLHRHLRRGVAAPPPAASRTTNLDPAEPSA